MNRQHPLRSIGGGAYRGKDSIESLYVDKEHRDVVFGQRDKATRSSFSVLLGKIIERVPASDYFDYNAWLDTQFPHVVFIAGKRGSGKSYDLGVLLEGIGSEDDANFAESHPRFATILFDLQSQFWSLGHDLRSEISGDVSQKEALGRWNIKGAVRKPTLYLPPSGVPVFGTEIKLQIPPRILELPDWLSLLSVERFEPMGQLAAVAIQVTVARKARFDIVDILETLNHRGQYPDFQPFQQSTIDALSWRLQAIDSTLLFLGADLLLLEFKANTGEDG